MTHANFFFAGCETKNADGALESIVTGLPDNESGISMHNILFKY